MVLSRREAMRRGLGGAAALLLPGSFAAAGCGRPSRPTEAKAKSVIQIWMWGGPSHLDTFDPKPEAGYDYCGPLNKPIHTNVDGILIGELLPLLAKQADKYSIIRSMTHGINAHETASYMVQTGRKPGGATGLSQRRRRGLALQGLRRRLPRTDSALHRADRAAGAVLRGGLPAARATNRSPPAAIRRRAAFVVEGVVAQGVTDAAAARPPRTCSTS